MIFDIFINSQATQLYCRVALETFRIRKPLLPAKTVKFGLVLEIGNRHLVIGKAAISQNPT